MLVSGYGLNGKENVVIVELKQWEMEAIVLEKNRARNRARILAGYCWNWPKATRNNTNFHDIEIGDYSISWNLNGGDAFAISEESVHEAGCIHTSQGLEFDYTGVIIGDDMRFENGKVITDYTKRAKTDNSLKGVKTLAKKDKEKTDRVADVLVYSQNLLDKLELDADEIVNMKMKQNEAKYPVDKAKGNATKYTEL